MDVSYPPEAEEFRAEVCALLAEELPNGWEGIGAIQDRAEAERFAEQWRRTLARRGFLGLTWPVEYGGRGLSKLHQVVLVEELARAGVPFGLPGDTFGLKMLGNTLLRWGTEEQKRRFLPRILTGEERWCQGFSEPGAGSDLASLRTSARLRDGEWVINGQKVWTSAAHQSDWIFVLSRTDPDSDRHHGVSFLLVPLDQPGIEIRPIRQINGESEFNEVFFTDASTAAENVVGLVGGGWSVAMTLLGHERGEEAATNPILFRAEFDRLRRMAEERGRSRDPLVRQRLAWCYSKVEIMRFLGYRVLTGWLQGAAPGPESSVSKLYWSDYHVAATELAMDLLGLDSIVQRGRGPLRVYRTDDPGAPNTSGSWSNVFLNARSGTIYAGTSEIQRNILAESVLGLPKEPRPSPGD